MRAGWVKAHTTAHEKAHTTAQEKARTTAQEKAHTTAQEKARTTAQEKAHTKDRNSCKLKPFTFFKQQATKPLSLETKRGAQEHQDAQRPL